MMVLKLHIEKTKDFLLFALLCVAFLLLLHQPKNLQVELPSRAIATETVAPFSSDTIWRGGSW